MAFDWVVMCVHVTFGAPLLLREDFFQTAALLSLHAFYARVHRMRNLLNCDYLHVFSHPEDHPAVRCIIIAA